MILFAVVLRILSRSGLQDRSVPAITLNNLVCKIDSVFRSAKICFYS